MIETTLSNGIKTITFNAPKMRNPMTPEVFKTLHDEIVKSYDDESKVIILTGAGGSFSSGAALGSMEPESFETLSAYLKTEVNPAIMAIRRCPKPFIAKVSGVCVGVAFNFALACDLIYADTTAKFSQIFTKIGLSTDGGGGYFMTKALGYQKAFELCAFADIIDGATAAKLGLINGLLNPDELDIFVEKTARRIIEGPYSAIQHTKINLTEGMFGTLPSTLDIEADNQAKNFQTPDFMEGVMAFMEKRSPKFTSGL